MASEQPHIQGTRATVLALRARIDARHGCPIRGKVWNPATRAFDRPAPLSHQQTIHMVDVALHRTDATRGALEADPIIAADLAAIKATIQAKDPGARTAEEAEIVALPSATRLAAEWKDATAGALPPPRVREVR